MTPETVRTWTPEALFYLFKEAYNRADFEQREATSERFESLVWHGTIRDAWEADLFRRVFPWDPDRCWEDLHSEIEQYCKDSAHRLIGHGTPIFIAFEDGAYPCVFCERATDQQVNEAVQAFYETD